MKTERITIKMPAAWKEELRQIALSDGLEMSAVIRLALSRTYPQLDQAHRRSLKAEVQQ